MIVRIVRLPADPAKFDELAELYKNGAKVVRSWPGSLKLELFQDADDPYTLVTISHWESEEALQDYRHSDYFRGFWPKVRASLRNSASAETLIPIDEP